MYSAFCDPLGHSAFMLRLVGCSCVFRPRARGGIANIGEVLRTGLPRETCVHGLAVVDVSFRERVCSPFCWAIQTFSCGGSFARAFCKYDPNVSVRRIEASFRKRFGAYAGTVGSPLVCRFCGMCLCACPGLYWCPPFAGLISNVLAAPLLEVSLSCRFFRFVLRWL